MVESSTPSPNVPLDLGDFDLLVRAREHWQAHADDASLPRFEQAIASRPDNIRALCEAARAFGMRFEVARAESYLQRAAELSRGDARVHVAIAQAYKVCHRPQRAIETFEHLLKQQGSLEPAALAELAELYEQVNRVDEAVEAVGASAAAASDRPEPRVILARLLRRRNAFAEADALLLKLTETTHGLPLVEAQAWAELCHLRDAQGAYDQAVMAIERAKSILKQMPQAVQLSKTAIANNQRLAKIYSGVDRHLVEQWRSANLASDPRDVQPAHLIGFPRSGTTLLEQVLDAHPRLVDAPELAVFTQGILPKMYATQQGQALALETFKTLSTDRLNLLRKRYLDLMANMTGQPLSQQILLDKNPNHTSLIVAIIRLFPESRYLFALRDPRDVVVSCYLRMLSLTEFSSLFLTWGSTCFQYGFDMQVWLRMRSLLEGQWIEIRYENLVNDLEAEARRTCAFLDLPWIPEMMQYRARADRKLVHSPSHDTVRKPVYTQAIGRWRNYEKYLAPYLDRLEPFVKAFGYE